MQSGWRIGSLFGIPLYIDPSWFTIVVLLTVSNGLNFQSRYQWQPLIAWGTGLAVALLLFGSVLLHELGHSLVARSQGIQVNSITLFLFGGVAAIDKESKTPGQAFQVAIAGPAVSIMLFFLLGIVGKLLPGAESASPLRVTADDVAYINLILGLFNLIPGLPLDGGQVLKAAVWKFTGDRFRGVHWAARTGKNLGRAAIAGGLLWLLLGESAGGIWIALIGWFVLQNASAYDRLTDLQEAMMRLRASEVMSREFRVVDARMSLRQFADEYLLWGGENGNERPKTYPYFAASEGRYRGLVSPNDLRFIERSQWETQTLQDIARPLADIVTVSESSSLAEVINVLDDRQLRYITVLSPAGAVAGTIDRGDVVRAVLEKIGRQVPEGEIKRIKTEGTYPSGLQLSEIAKSTERARTEGNPD